MMNDSLKWSGKLVLMMKGDILRQKINILNESEERIHESTSTLKLRPSDKRFIIKTITDTIDKIDYTRQEKEQELFYKIMMMEKILQQRMDLHKKTGICNKTERNWHNCVSTDLDVALNRKFTIKLNNIEKTEIRKLNLYVNFYGNITHLQIDTGYISPIWLKIVDNTHHLDQNSLNKKRESSPWQTHNTSYNSLQQISHLSRKKAKPISNLNNSNHRLKIDRGLQKANFRHFPQQKQGIWNQQKERKFKGRKQKMKTDLKRGSRFHDFCRRNNLAIHFNEYISDRPIISFNNKNPIPTHWKIRNINQRFIIRKLLATAHGKGKYYKLEIEIKDKFQQLTAMKRTQNKDLLKQLRPWKQLQTNLTAKRYYIIPNENEIQVKKQKLDNIEMEAHELTLQGPFLPIEYLDFLSITIKKECEPKFILLTITLQDMNNKFIIVKNDYYNNNIKSMPSEGRRTRKYIKEESNDIFSHQNNIRDHCHLKHKFMERHIFNIALNNNMNELLRLAFNVDCFRKNLPKTMIQKKLRLISNLGIRNYLPIKQKRKEIQHTQENANPKRFKKEENDSRTMRPKTHLQKMSKHSEHNEWLDDYIQLIMENWGIFSLHKYYNQSK